MTLEYLRRCTHTPVRAVLGASSAYDIPTQARRSRLVVLNILYVTLGFEKEKMAKRFFVFFDEKITNTHVR